MDEPRLTGAQQIPLMEMPPRGAATRVAPVVPLPSVGGVAVPERLPQYAPLLTDAGRGGPKLWHPETLHNF